MKVMLARSAEDRDRLRYTTSKAHHADLLADDILKHSGLMEIGSMYFKELHVPEAIAVLRFHGFEVEVEE